MQDTKGQEELTTRLDNAVSKIYELENRIVILKAKDVARILQININQATSLFKRKSFPALVNCRR